MLDPALGSSASSVALPPGIRIFANPALVASVGNLAVDGHSTLMAPTASFVIERISEVVPQEYRMSVYPLQATNDTVVWRFQYPAASNGTISANNVIASRVVDGSVVSTFSHVKDGNQYREVFAGTDTNDNPVTVRNTCTTNGTQIVYHREISGSAGGVVSVRENTFQIFSWGASLLSSVESFGNLNLTSLYSNVPSGPCAGLVARAETPDGRRIQYEYDDQGRTTLTREWFDVAYSLPPPAVGVSVTTYDYTPWDGADTSSSYEARIITETRDGQIVSRQFFSSSRNANNEVVLVRERCLRPDAARGDIDNVRTVSTLVSDTAPAAITGKIKGVTYQDGRMDVYDYTMGTWIPDGSASGMGMFVAGEGDAFRADLRHVAVAATNGLPWESIREINIRDEVGQHVRMEKAVLDATGLFRTFAVKENYFDIQGRPAGSWDSQVGSVKLESDCCGIGMRVNADGSTEYYTHDALGRVASETRAGIVAGGQYPAQEDITTRNTYDALGHVLATVRSAGVLSLTTSNVYDSAGRLIRQIDEAGNITETRFDSVSRTLTIRAGLTNITELGADGRVAMSQSGVNVPQYYTYGCETNGQQWTMTQSGSRWEKTWTDMLGRTVRSEKPGFGGGTLAAQSLYDDLGHLIRRGDQTSSGVLTTLYSYTALGELFRTSVDVNDNGVIDLGGTDRVSENSEVYEFDASSNCWRKAVAIIYPFDSQATAVTSTVSRTRLSGFCSNVTAEAVSLDLLGNEVRQQTFTYPSSRAVTQIVTYPDSTNTAVQVAVNGLLVFGISKTGVKTDYGYDDLGRQIRSFSNGGNRSVGAMSHYNALGQVDWTMDVESNRTTYVYDSQGRRTQVADALTNTTYTAYDPEGRVLATWGATYPVVYDYDSYGRMIAMYTYRGSSTISSYSAITNLLSQMDRTRWLYDEATGLLTNKLYADGHGPSYAYTADGKLATRTWSRGIVTTYNYDNLGQLSNISYSDGTPAVEFAFDRLGRQTTITDGTGSRSFSYNDALQLAAETNALGTLQFAFDNLGRPSGFDSGPNYSTRYTFDPLGRFTTLSNLVGGALCAATYSYLEGSDLIAGYALSSGGTAASLSVGRSYEPTRNLITSITNSFGSVSLHRFDYVNDQIGRRVQRADVDIS